MSLGKLFLGVDGGGSNTRTLLVDDQFQPVALGKAGGCNPHNCGFENSGNRIDAAVTTAIESLEPSSSYKIDAIYCGIAGIRNEEERTRLEDSLSRFNWSADARLAIDSDLSIAYEASLGDRAGICLAIGTGAACIGKDDSGRIFTSSNRLPDGEEPGSGFAIGNDAISASLATPENDERYAIAAIAKQVTELARAGDIKAREILDRNSSTIVPLVREILENLSFAESTLPIVIAGGLGSADTLYRVLIQEKLTAAFPQVRFRFPESSAVAVAAKRAFRMTGA